MHKRIQKVLILLNPSSYSFPHLFPFKALKRNCHYLLIQAAPLEKKKKKRMMVRQKHSGLSPEAVAILSQPAIEKLV